MKYGVTVPIAGHAYIEVEAASPKEAILEAIQNVGSEHLLEWEALGRFNQGNVCYCPSPWEADAEALDEALDE
jgi:hypothetical protein